MVRADPQTLSHSWSLHPHAPVARDHPAQASLGAQEVQAGSDKEPDSAAHAVPTLCLPGQSPGQPEDSRTVATWHGHGVIRK